MADVPGTPISPLSPSAEGVLVPSTEPTNPPPEPVAPPSASSGDHIPSASLASAASLVDSLIQTSEAQSSMHEQSRESSSSVPPPAPATKKKNGGKGIIIGILLLLLISLPIGVYFISQQSGRLTEIRSRADEPYPTTSPRHIRISCDGNPHGYEAIAFGNCNNGDDPWNTGVPDGNGLGCDNGSTPVAHFVCDGLEPSGQGCGYDNGEKIYDGPGPRTFTRDCGMEQIDTAGPSHSSISIIHCEPCEETPPEPSPTPTVGPSPTPTPSPTPPVGQCGGIRIYRGSTIIPVTSLVPGETVNIAVIGIGAEVTKARIRFNPTDMTWRESTQTQNAIEYIFPWTVPSNTSEFTIEAEIFINGVWK